MSELSLDLQDQYVAWRVRALHELGISRPSNATVQRELTLLKAALNAYRKRGYLKEVPYVRSLPAPPPRDRFLSETEARRLLAECHEPHLRLFVLVALHTLQRPGAVLGLRTDQVRLADGHINFLPTGSLQTNKRRPIVPITRTLRPHLITAMERSQSGFVIEYDGRPVKSVRTSFNKAAKRAGLTDVSPYTLRHTGATLLAKEGVPLWQIAGMLGHSQARTTEIYAKHSPEFLKDAAGALDRMFG